MTIDHKKLLLAMARAQLKDSEVCEKSGIMPATLGALKAGKNNTKPRTVGKVAAALGVDPEDLIAEE